MEIPAWCLLIVWVIAGVGGTYLTCPGCVNRTWQNIACVLTGDDVRPLDVRNAEHRQHPIEDAQLAKEPAVRYAAPNIRSQVRWQSSICLYPANTTP